MTTTSLKHAGALGKKGILDWILLRASAIVITLYTIFILCFLIFNSITYDVWIAFFTSPSTKVFTLLALVAVLVHAWIGLWQVLTDYVKPLAIRFFLQVFVILTLAVYVLYGVTVLWSV